MDFVDYINFIAATVGRKQHLVLDLPNVVNPGIGRAVDFDNVKAGAFSYLAA